MTTPVTQDKDTSFPAPATPEPPMTDLRAIRVWVTIIGICVLLSVLGGVITGIVLGAEAAHAHAQQQQCQQFGLC